MPLKHAKSDRRVPSFYRLVAAVIFVAFFLIALWVFSSPSQRPQELLNEVSSKVENQLGADESSSSRETFVEKEEDALEPDEKEEEDIQEDGSNKGKSDRDSETSPRDDQQQVDDGIVGARNSADAEKSSSSTTDEQEKTLSEVTGTAKLPEALPSVAQSELTTENTEVSGSWTTQAKESIKEKEQESHLKAENESAQNAGTNQAAVPQELEDREEVKKQDEQVKEELEKSDPYHWKLCKGGDTTDFIPCLDNQEAIKKLPTTIHYEHRERHCPSNDESDLCLVPLPKGYKPPVRWPRSRDEIYYNNVPHPGLASYKKDQNWVKKSGELLIFPGGGTQFKGGASHYIDYVEHVLPDIAWGKHTRVILDVGCGVASFAGFLFDKDVLTMSFAPKDEHEAQVQFALERGIPAISAVMGTQRLVFPSNVFDAVHCARCRVPWHLEGGKLLLEINRVLRPGGYFIWSATPVYLHEAEDVQIWKETASLAAAMCWNQLARTADSSTRIGVAIFQKPKNNFCYEHRKRKRPPICKDNEKPDAAWYVPMQACVHKIPSEDGERSTEWPQEWPLRLEATPSWLSNMPKGLYGKPAAEGFRSDADHWKRVVEKSYMQGLGIDWDAVRNVMDMNARYGGFAAALTTRPVWVMNVVPTSEPDTLPVIFDRGLLGIYHDWCESFSTYPRTYDLLHADHLFSRIGKRCNHLRIVVEMDRILRPQGWVIFREKVSIMNEIEPIIKSLHWDIRFSYSQEKEQLLAVQKTMWRPASTDTIQ
ncbi:hypothetical protein O6H91_22G040700 [Diphasiastrum complanatum]|uniref:Uncharacterized protein n=2 Tax=Diphasiastrum complanatum TaxID=34168 RepID=A0ACC2AER1_DIPCM|nr:hypothetical protein O6H91_22G040700 [Diphasiastrum complanatum]KAJ7516058.1 hypothetical protein O6H91_22G040700 [Diphasiastrum complanatum]